MKLYISFYMSVCAGSVYAHLFGGPCTQICVCLSMERVHAHMCTGVKGCVPGMGAYGCVCPSVHGECTCLCPLGLPCPQVIERQQLADCVMTCL